MPPTVTNSFKAWLKASTNIKLSSNSAVKRLTYKGITTFQSLEDFDKKAIQSLTSVCTENIPAITEDVAAGIAAVVEIPGTNISSILVQCLIIAAKAVRNYISINRAMTTVYMHYGNILSIFKIEWEAYIVLKSEDAPKSPAIQD